jgi:hypothetical protein
MDSYKNFPDFIYSGNYPHGLLPDGVFPCDEALLRRRFVEAFPGSATREEIYDGFLRLRSEATQMGINAVQWLNGSFVEEKLNPGDIDIVNFVDYDFYGQANSEIQRFIRDVLGGTERVKELYGAHSFLVLSCAENHRYHIVFEPARKFWRNFFSKACVKINAEEREFRHTKGFAQIALGQPELVPKISVERE